MRFSFLLAISVAHLLAAGNALAQTAPITESSLGDVVNASLVLDEVIFRRAPLAQEQALGTSTFASSVVEGTFRRDALELEARFPFLIFDVDDSHHSGTPAIAGNVELGGYYAWGTHGTHVRVGALFTLPTAPAASPIGMRGDLAFSAALPDYLQEAAWSRGWDRAWLWTRHQITPFAPAFRLSSPPRALFQHATEVVFAPMVAVDPGSSTFPLFAQASQELGLHPSVFRLGVRVQFAGVLGAPSALSATGSVGQFSVLPFAGFDVGGFFLDGGVLVNTADPVGMGATVDGQASWSLRLRAGGRF